MFADLQQTHTPELHVYNDSTSGLRALIAIHSTRLGPALGGCRFLPYQDEQSALTDAMRLAHAMSYKAALAGLALGGGKAVLMAPSGDYDRAALFRAFGRAVDSLQGRYITAEDSGSELDDLDHVAEETRHVWGHHGDGLDPSPFTAEGILAALCTALRHQLGTASVRGRHFAIQGVGHIGGRLARRLSRAGARLTLADRNRQRVEQLAGEVQARVVAADTIHKVSCDAFMPCALGATLNAGTITDLQTSLVVGSANNQLATDQDAERLHRRNILYVPDYLANAGGIIALARGHAGDTPAQIRPHVQAIGSTLADILRDAARADCTPARMADQYAERRLGDRPNQAVA